MNIGKCEEFAKPLSLWKPISQKKKKKNRLSYMKKATITSTMTHLGFRNTSIIGLAKTIIVIN